MHLQSELGIDKGQSKAGRRDWVALLVLALPCILYSMDLTVLNLALPQISRVLKPSSVELLWIVDVYGFMLAGFLIPMGTLGDRIGRRKLLLVGASAFGLASVGAAYATSVPQLIAARAVLGIAGSTLAPSTLSLISNLFHNPKQRSLAIGVWVTSYSVGGAIGPLIGGVLLAHFGWGSVFLVGVPVMALLLLVGPFLLPEFRDSVIRPIDSPSIILSLLSVLLVIFGLKKIVTNGLHELPVACILLGLVAGLLFVQRQKRLPVPLIDLGLFEKPAFSTALTIYTLATFVVYGQFIFTFQYLELIARLTPMQAGWWSLPFFLAFIIGSIVTPLFTRQVRPGSIMATGLFGASVGFGLLTQVDQDSGLLFLVAGTFIYCLGTAPVFTLATDIIVGSVSAGKSGVASALSETGSEFGGALGIAVLGTIGTALYRSRLADNMPAEVSELAVRVSQQTLTAAVEQARSLPTHLSHSLLNEAYKAFISGLQMSAFVCAFITLILATLCLIKISPLPIDTIPHEQL